MPQRSSTSRTLLGDFSRWFPAAFFLVVLWILMNGPGVVQAEAPAFEGPELREALVAEAAEPLAKWYGGRVEFSGRWLSIDEAQRAAAADERLSDYRELRDRSDDSLRTHERLARWCQRNDVAELAELHWLHVLRFAPQHAAALNALEMRWIDGILMTDDEATKYTENVQQLQRQAHGWKPKAKRIRRTIERGNAAKRREARLELLAVQEPAAVPALVDEFAPPGVNEESTQRLHAALMETLGRIDADMAVDVLLDFAMSSPHETVRYAAVRQLRRLPQRETVPPLLSQLRLPVEATFSTTEEGNCVISRYCFEQERHDGQTYTSSYTTTDVVPGQRFAAADVYQRRSVQRPGGCGSGPTTVQVASYVGTIYGRELPQYKAAQQATVARAHSLADGVGDEVTHFNAELAEHNERIAGLLVEVTGEMLDAFPKSWWNWWRRKITDNPALAADDALGRLNQTLLNQLPRAVARGTHVWTLDGQRPIEGVLVGDFVLSQSPETGELGFKPVVASAAMGRRPVSKLEVGKGTITSPNQQVFWLSGIGWRRQQDVAQGQFIHGVEKEVATGELEETYDLDCYQLIVKDFHTFFVGSAGVLTHDGAPIGPSANGLPGAPR